MNKDTAKEVLTHVECAMKHTKALTTGNVTHCGNNVQYHLDEAITTIKRSLGQSSDQGRVDKEIRIIEAQED